MIRRLSPAKINLHLRVLGKREDGYHEIVTLMQRISLCDEMEFHFIEKGVEVSCPGSSLPENEDNIAHRAAALILERSRRKEGIHISIHKRIPVAAGLGGGSSNAATTLVTLNELTGLDLSTDDLMKMGAKLGADVPFFIFRKTAWAFGIGDRLQAVDTIPNLWFVLINPRFTTSTKMVYERLNLQLTKPEFKYKCPKLNTIEDLMRVLHNDLEKVTLALHPVLQELKDLLMQHGALGALMSGSGPTVAGFFGKESEALKAEESLSKIGKDNWLVFRAHSI
ncbi:MAG: 4-(cytidine 5'-diphospho)-2-C-methyl-D-erythritol kinase [Deltaproteobacteria bacterium]|nr:4-(cytidine 5'-diphospho)-2-C-methyl-D-erythritol kinase [Deltaproteobacteria bacterium]